MDGIEIKPLIINPTNLCLKDSKSQAENEEHDGEEYAQFDDVSD